MFQLVSITSIFILLSMFTEQPFRKLKLYLLYKKDDWFFRYKGSILAVSCQKELIFFVHMSYFFGTHGQTSWSNFILSKLLWEVWLLKSDDNRRAFNQTYWEKVIKPCLMMTHCWDWIITTTIAQQVVQLLNGRYIRESYNIGYCKGCLAMWEVIHSLHVDFMVQFKEWCSQQTLYCAQLFQFPQP